MTWIASQAKWILLVGGLLTLTMLYAALAPEAALRSTFGESLAGPVAAIVVRSWGALVALVGAMLVYAAFRPAARPLVLVVAGVSKLVYVVLVLTSGFPFLEHPVRVSLVVDSLLVVLFAACLAGRGEAASPAIESMDGHRGG